MDATQIGAHLGILGIALAALAVPPIWRWVWKTRTRKVVFVLLIIVAEVAAYLIWRPPSFPPGTKVVLLPLASADVRLDLASSNWGSPVPGSSGAISPQGTLQVSGLAPNATYHLCLNGKPGQPPNDIVQKPGYGGSTEKGEGYWDFRLITTDGTGGRRDVKLEVTVPTEGWREGQTYDVKFFVKDANYRVVLFNDQFLFRVKKVEE